MEWAKSWYGFSSCILLRLIVSLWVLSGSILARPQPPTSNPAASQKAPGTGELGRLLGLPADAALRISGVWVGNGTDQWIGGRTGLSATNGVQSLLTEASLDLGKAIGLENTWIWVQGLQVNATTDAGQASVIFANINRPDTTSDFRYGVQNLTSLAFTPIYSMPTLLGRLPGYSNSALGLAVTAQPEFFDDRSYISLGVDDGRGYLRDASVQTGLDSPSLEGPLFSIAEVGSGWVVGKARKPGSAGLGVWSQGGESVVCQQANSSNCFTEVGAWG